MADAILSLVTNTSSLIIFSPLDETLGIFANLRPLGETLGIFANFFTQVRDSFLNIVFY